jgi:hypothetical protein
MARDFAATFSPPFGRELLLTIDGKKRRLCLWLSVLLNP